jgi:rSAM-associated Gly-rich repeat protein
MFRNLFAATTTLLLGAAGAQASTPATTPTDLESRVSAAQTTISKLMDVDQAPATAKDGEKVAQYWGNYYRPRWHDWNNWRNYYRRYYY